MAKREEEKERKRKKLDESELAQTVSGIVWTRKYL
jgi:hypothetical protein